MRLIKTLILFVLCNFTFAAMAVEGQYTTIIHLPQEQSWKMVTNEQDAAGYTKVYVPSSSTSTYPQNLFEGFTLGDKTPLKDAMQVVVNQHKGIPCRQNDIHMISMQKNVSLFTATLAGCNNGKSLFQIFKSFNMDDGNYSIVYAADPSIVSQTTIEKMTAAVKSATIK